MTAAAATAPLPFSSASAAAELRNMQSIPPFDDYQEPSRYSSLVSADVVSYARNNFDKPQPNSGDGIVPYYDFSDIPGNWDCTNFVSHALLAGGANVYDTGGNGISSTGWYVNTCRARCKIQKCTIPTSEARRSPPFKASFGEIFRLAHARLGW